jgi:hypothetical protein
MPKTNKIEEILYLKTTGKVYVKSNFKLQSDEYYL